MAKFRVQTELSADKGSSDRVRDEFRKVSAGAKQASIDVKDLTKSIGAGISIFAVARQNLQALAPVMERNGQLFKSMAVGLGADADAVDALGLGLDSLIHPSKIIENAIKATEIGSRKLQEAWVGETEVVLNLSKAQLKAVDSYLAMGGAAGAFARMQEKAVKEQQEIGDTLERLLKEQLRDEEKLADQRKANYEEYKRNLQAIMDRLNPVAAAERDLNEQIELVNRALAAGGPNANLYEQALASLREELVALRTVAELTANTINTLPTPARMGVRDIEGVVNAPDGFMTVTQVETAAMRYQDAFEEANQQLSASLQAGLSSAFTAALIEFANGGEDAMKHFGDAMLQVLLNAVAEWLVAQLAAIAKAAIASKAISGGSGGGGAGGMGGIASMFGGGGGAAGGMSSGAMALGAWVAIAAAAVAVIKHQSDRRESQRYQTTVAYHSNTGDTQMSGRLQETGGKIAAAFAELLASVQASTGALIDGTHNAAIAIQNNKGEFQARVDGVLLGTFKTAEEAIVAAMKNLFSAENLKNKLDPIVQQVIDNFDAKKGPQAFAEAVQAVTGIVDELSGLTEIEIALRDMPSQAAQLATELHQMGVSMNDATAVAAKWTAQQFTSIRDQITGHQMSAAEQRAEKERQATYFNAQLALAKANMALMKMEIEAKVANFNANSELAASEAKITNWKYEMDSWKIKRDLDLLGTNTMIANEEIRVRSAAANVSLEMLQLQLAAINQAMAALDAIKPIDFKEIKLGNVGGGGGGVGNINTGPTPAEIAAQLAADIAAFWQDIAASWRATMPAAGAAIAQLNMWYEEQAARARELGLPIEELNALYEAQLYHLKRDTLASLGLESVATTHRFEDLANTLSYLRKWGAITEDQIRELGDTLYISLVDGLMKYVDNEDVRRQLEEMRFILEMHNYELQFQMLIALGLLTEAQIATIEGLIGDIWESYEAGALNFQLPASTVNQTQNNNTGVDDARANAENALRQALDRLRNAVESLREFQEGLTLSAVSPLTTAQQYQVAAQQYADMLAAAQGGDLEAIEGLGAAAQAYLELAAQMFGTSGSGYAAIFDAVSQQVAAIAAMGQQILDSVPPQMAGTEERLDTIAEILIAIANLSNNANDGGGGNNHAGLVYYGPLWGWHPIGWAPSGGFSPIDGNPGATSPFAGGGSSPNTTTGNFGGGPGTAPSVRAPEIVAELRALRDAHTAATIEAKQDRMKKTTGGLSGFYGNPIGAKRSA